MKIAKLKGEKTLKALVKRLLAEQPKGRAKKSDSEMEAALLRSNPHLQQIEKLEKGTPVLVPEEFSLDRNESASPFTGTAEELLNQSESALAELREKLAEQVAQDAEQTELARRWLQSDEAKQLLRTSPELKEAFASAAAATKTLPKEHAATLAQEEKALEKVRAELAAFKRGESR